MKRLILIIFLLLPFRLVAKTDSIMIVDQKIDNLKREIVELKKDNFTLQTKNINLANAIDSIKRDIEVQRANTSKLQQETIELNHHVDAGLDKININVSDINSNLTSKSLIYGICCVLLFIGIIISYYVFKRKTDSSHKLLTDIDNAQKELEKKSVKLDTEILEVLDKQLKINNSGVKQDTEPDHSLALKMADEIVRIQNNVDRMNPKEPSVIRLNKALDRMKNSFKAYGYEIVDMRGQEYTDNMTFEARFIPDDNIEEGKRKRIISGMDRLMVRYKDKMIQSPILAVRQNV